LDILTRVSTRVPVISVGAFLAVVLVEPVTGWGAALGAAWVGAGAAAYGAAGAGVEA